MKVSRADLNRSPGYQLWKASNAWQRLVRRALEPVGLTHGQFFLLAAVAIIGAEEECVSQAQIARFADFDENTTSSLVRCLTDRGLLERTPHPIDARARQIRLTPAGVAALEAARAVVKPLVAEFFAPLDDPEALAEQLRQLVANAEE